MKVKMKSAAQYYNESLLIKYGIIPFARMMVIARHKERQAVIQYRMSLKRMYFRKLRNSTSIQIAERRHAEMYEL